MKYLILLLPLFIMACGNSPDIEINDFEPLSNFNTDTNKTADIYLDYTNAIDSGFVIPSAGQVKGGKFTYRFRVKNNTGSDAEFFYKLYYQNESYAFELADTINRENLLSSENFYGSFENPADGFISTGIIPADDEFHIVEGQFRITGNPRNERRYYGPIARDKYLSGSSVKKYTQAINNIPEWLAAVREKARKNGVSFEEQAKLDAEYTTLLDREKDTLNQRWQRNPRTGSYSFLLTVVQKKDIAQIPEHIQYIDKVNEKGHFTNPYYYFLRDTVGKHIPGTKLLVKNLICVKAKPDFSKGIYFNRQEYPHQPYSKQYFNSICSSDSMLYYTAEMQQFFHKVDAGEFYYNIPVVANVNGDGYTLGEYKKNAELEKNKRIKSQIHITECPCKTVSVDSNRNIVITNPASSPSEKRKENVGACTRHGLTYGKYRVKVKMPGLLNKYDVWNGITNAVWMITQSTESWNNRRECCKKGYIPKNVIGKDSARVPVLAYSEIDFEILKCNRYWPSTSYPELVITPKESPEDASKIVVTCTNWDMACPEPPYFNIGYQEFDIGGKKWGLHRWDVWHQALTAKYACNDIFDEPYYYFEIEWKPEEIIWRIGPEKDKMEVVTRVNETISSIPNNQMFLVFTQEYHVGRWWPESPQPQENIPFPAKDISGYIMEIEIE